MKRLLIKFIWLLAGVHLFLGISLSPARANVISELVVFGDSLSDTGNLFDATGGVFPPPLSGYDNGRFSNGPIWIEALADRLGIAVPIPNRFVGTNYAWGGAETGFGLSFQNTPNIGEQINAFLAGNTPMSDQLLVIWGGSNDFNNAVGPLPNPSDLVDNIAFHITTLANNGIDLQFLIPNLPPLGQTVRAQLLGQNVDPFIPIVLDLLSAQFNSLLATQLEVLKIDLGVTIIELDVFGLVQEIILDPLAFDFTNITEHARLPNMPSILNVGIPCMPTQDCPRIVPNPDEYVYFDDVHPTTAFHQILGARAFAAVPEPATIMLMGLGLASVGFARRKRRLNA